MIKSEIADEFSERGIIGDELKTAYAAKPEIVNRLENLCRRSMNSVWKERILTVYSTGQNRSSNATPSLLN